MKTKRVGIVTFIDDINYGAILQAYSLGKYLMNLGLEVYYIRPDDLITGANKPKNFVKRLFYYLIAKRRIVDKGNIFHSFIKEHFKVLTEKQAKELLNGQEDIIICGSDQIWNREITHGKYCGLYFGVGFQNAISYAASAGDIRNNSVEQTHEFIGLIKNLKAISVRESDLKEYIQINSDLIVTCVCDPTFLIESNDYLFEPIVIRKPYILIYQMSNNKILYEAAKILARQMNAEIIEVNNNVYNYILSNHKTIYSASIGKFLSLIKNAEYVITNSFHGTALSINFQKQFFSVLNSTRNTRIVNLLDGLGLKDRIIDETTLNSILDIHEIKYDLTTQKARLFVEESKKYLIRNIK